MAKQRAIYPGSFDPVTYGHLDLIKRARMFFDRIFVVLMVNPEKQFLFSIEERLLFMRRACQGMPDITVDHCEGLTVDYARSKKAQSIVRGLRATSDFDYEFQMALTNRKLSTEVDTIFLMPSEHHFYISSKLIKEIAALKGNISEYVPDYVAKKLQERFS